jgi:hypothetical protein
VIRMGHRRAARNAFTVSRKVEEVRQRMREQVGDRNNKRHLEAVRRFV